VRGIEPREFEGRTSLMLRGSQAGFIGRHRGLAPCGSEAQEIPPQLHQEIKGLTSSVSPFSFECAKFVLNNFSRILCSGVRSIFRSKNYKGLALRANPFRFTVLIFQPRILVLTPQHLNSDRRQKTVI
jgi:hypothetical protein